MNRSTCCLAADPCWQVRLNTYSAPGGAKFFIIRTALTRAEARRFVDAHVPYFETHGLITYYFDLNGRR